MTPRQSTRAQAAAVADATGRYCYDYPRPAVTVDIVLFAFEAADLQLLLVARAKEPFANQWALPGGFVEMDEPLDAAARRELLEETGFSAHYVEQLHAFGTPDRDPRGRTISIAHLALASAEEVAQMPPRAADDAVAARWWGIDTLPSLAFDHAQIVTLASDRLRASIERPETSRALLPATFTLSTLQRLHERILGVSLDKRNFRRKLMDSMWLQESGDYSTAGHRPARLYRFAPATDAVPQQDPR